ncbi:MAG: urea carboxylase-associated family protein [Alphaproteobacteria bacterium]
MTELDLITIPAGQGKAARVKAGQHVRVVNTHGTQCIDTWAFVDGHMDRIMSMERCREAHLRICFEVGDVMISNGYQTMFTIVADTSPGRHDSIIAACSEATYVWAGHPSGHGNCSDNLRAALDALGVVPLFTPSPWNLFMLAPVIDGLHIEYQRPTCKPGDYVELRAEADCIIAFSACPDDIWPTNGGDGKPVDAHFAIFDPSG